MRTKKAIYILLEICKLAADEIPNWFDHRHMKMSDFIVVCLLKAYDLGRISKEMRDIPWKKNQGWLKKDCPHFSGMREDTLNHYNPVLRFPGIVGILLTIQRNQRVFIYFLFFDYISFN